MRLHLCHDLRLPFLAISCRAGREFFQGRCVVVRPLCYLFMLGLQSFERLTAQVRSMIVALTRLAAFPTGPQRDLFKEDCAPWILITVDLLYLLCQLNVGPRVEHAFFEYTVRYIAYSAIRRLGFGRVNAISRASGGTMGALSLWRPNRIALERDARGFEAVYGGLSNAHRRSILDAASGLVHI